MKTVRKIKQNQSVQCSRLRVAAYCRVSTDYDAQLESLETQKSHYENYIRLQDNLLNFRNNSFSALRPDKSENKENENGK